ncbi:MAG: CsbD family protein [Anaeromyxobacteraceae bacterium]
MKDKLKGKLETLKGKGKEAAGVLTGKPELEAEGKSQARAGKVQEKLGEIEKVLGK